MAVIHTLFLLMAVLKLNCRHAVSIFSLNVFLKYHKSDVDNYGTRDC